LPLAAPSPQICQLTLSRTAIFVTPSLGAAAITGVLKCTVQSPGGGIANGYCSLSYGSHPPTHPPAPPHRHIYSSTILAQLSLFLSLLLPFSLKFRLDLD
jgi:hypothetical protein